MKRFETVFFDMGGTLETLDFDAALRRAASENLYRFLQDSGLDPACPSEAFHTAVVEGLAAYKRWNVRSMEELPADRICSEFILKDFGFSEADLHPVSDDFMLRLETRFYDRRVRPEARGVLESLRDEGFKLGIISNVMSRGCVEFNLSRYGLLEFFDVLISSSAYGRRKPDPRIFLYAAQEIGSPPEWCVHVGDKTSRDILGAVRAGFGLSVRIEHPEIDGAEPREPAASAVVDDLTGVVEVITRACAAAAEGDDPEGARTCAILFDAGDILYHRPRKGKRFKRFLASCGLEATPEARANADASKQRAMVGEVSKREYFETYLRACGIRGDEEIERGIRALHEDADDVEFFEMVRETLIELKARGYRLGILTDTYHPKDSKDAWLERNGMDGLWDVYVASCDVGVRKPHPRIYEAALDHLGVRAEESAFVGHKKSELDGAEAVGIATVAFNQDPDVRGHRCIERFEELLSLFPSVDGQEDA